MDPERFVLYFFDLGAIHWVIRSVSIVFRVGVVCLADRALQHVKRKQVREEIASDLRGRNGSRTKELSAVLLFPPYWSLVLELWTIEKNRKASSSLFLLALKLFSSIQ